MDFRLVAVILGVVLPIGLPVAAPFLPQHDGQVLERLPARRDDPAMAELRQLRERLAAAPGNAEAAAALAQRYFELASADGFAGALADLERTLALDPEHVEARAWRAAIFMVQADYPAAARECVALDGRASELLATGCAAYVEATTGDARGAYRRLAEALRRATAAGPYARLWTLTRLAEMATRLSDDAGAERHFRDALALGITDNFVLAAYADFLLAHRRAAEVVALLKDWERSDTLLLRLALAEQSLGLPAAARHSQALGERFAAAALRRRRPATSST